MFGLILVIGTGELIVVEGGLHGEAEEVKLFEEFCVFVIGVGEFVLEEQDVEFS